MLFLAKHIWARPMLMILGMRLKIHGKENIDKKQHYLIVANHASYSDIPVLFRTLPFNVHYIAKAELKKVPLLGWYMKTAGIIFMDRKNNRNAKASIIASGELMKKGKSVAIFPEGTTSITGEVAKFKKGGMHVAMAAESIILPIKIKGSFEAWPSTSNFKIRGGRIDVIIDKPIPFEDYKDEDVNVFLTKLRQQIIDL